MAKEAVAERDFLAALAKEAKKHARKQSVTFDPIAKDLMLGGDSIRNYVPETSQDAKPMHPNEAAFLAKQGIDPSGLRYSGQATKLIDIVIQRDKLGLAPPKMINQLMLFGWPEELAVKMKKGQAGVLIGKRIWYKAPKT